MESGCKNALKCEQDFLSTDSFLWRGSISFHQNVKSCLLPRKGLEPLLTFSREPPGTSYWKVGVSIISRQVSILKYQFHKLFILNYIMKTLSIFLPCHQHFLYQCLSSFIPHHPAHPLPGPTPCLFCSQTPLPEMAQEPAVQY